MLRNQRDGRTRRDIQELLRNGRMALFTLNNCVIPQVFIGSHGRVQVLHDGRGIRKTARDSVIENKKDVLGQTEMKVNPLVVLQLKDH